MSFALLNKSAAAGTFWASFPIPRAWAPWNDRNITSKPWCMRFLSIIGNWKGRSFEKVYLTREEEGSGGFVIGEQSLVNGRLRSGGDAHGNPRSREREGSSSIGGRGEEGRWLKKDRGRHCRERSWRSVAKEKGMGMRMRMVNQSLHMIRI